MYAINFYYLQFISLLILIFISLVTFFFGRLLTSKGICILFALFLITNILLLLLINFKFLTLDNVIIFNIANWAKIKFFLIEWTFQYNNLNKTMLLIVYVITFCVVIYSFFYMFHDAHVIRFYGCICLFVIFMQIFIVSGNFVTLFLGWEGIGVCSYLLVNFWYTRINANKSALKAILVNRFGDLSLILAISLIYFLTLSSDFNVCAGLLSFYISAQLNILTFKVSLLFLISFFIISGAVGKSAQIGLHLWLPDAMEGPTPISALIHAATMVTAGVLLVIKTAFIFEQMPLSLLILVFVGGLTAFFAASAGLFQTDIKKIIAYSTCSQLGYMIFVCGFSNYSTSFFHLINHAFFKALLFLCAGSLIHSVLDNQDLRKFGGLFQSLIFTAVCFFIGSLALAGFPFLSGFYSKDLILELSYAQYNFLGTALFFSGLLTAIFTICYSYKIYFYAFMTKFLSSKFLFKHIQESNFFTNLVLLSLTLGSIFFGWNFKEKCVGLGSNFLGQTNYINTLQNSALSGEFLKHFIKILPFFSIIASLYIVALLYHFRITIANKINQGFLFLSKKWFFDDIVHLYINKPFLVYSYNTNFLFLDKGVFEIFVTKFITKMFVKTNFLSFNKSVQTGIFFNYSFFFINFSLFIFSLFSLISF